MGRIIFLSVYLIASHIGLSQTTQEHAIDETLKTVIHDVLTLATARNVSKIDEKYVHPEFGVYDVFRIGVPDTFQQHSSIGFAFPTEQNYSMYPNFTEITQVASVQNIVNYNANFDCNEMVWDREGIFITDSISYPKISEVIKQSVFETSEFPESLHRHAKHIEENSYRVVFTEFDIIFYVTNIDGRWYLTLFDRVTTDCSA